MGLTIDLRIRLLNVIILVLHTEFEERTAEHSSSAE